MTTKSHMNTKFISSMGVFSFTLSTSFCFASSDSCLGIQYVRAFLLLLVPS